MNQHGELLNPAFRLGPEVEVYRLTSRRGDITDEGFFKPSAFYRRRDDYDGVSVQIASECQLDDEVGMVDAPLTKLKGILSILVQEIRDVRVSHYELDVVARPDVSPSEAVVTNIPFRDEDEESAERIAELLADERRLIWIRESNPS